MYMYIYIIYYICKKTINHRQKNMIVESQADLGQQIQVHGTHGTHMGPTWDPWESGGRKQ